MISDFTLVATGNEQPGKLIIEVTDLRSKEQSWVGFVNDKFLDSYNSLNFVR